VPVQPEWTESVAAIFFHDLGRAGVPAVAGATAIDAPRAAGAAGFDGSNNQVSKSVASDVPDTFSAYFWKSPTDAFP
jgi:hypothetical protein